MSTTLGLRRFSVCKDPGLAESLEFPKVCRGWTARKCREAAIKSGIAHDVWEGLLHGQTEVTVQR